MNFFPLQTNKELDREQQANHTLIIKASEDCNNPPPPLNSNRPEPLTNDTEPLDDDLKIVLNHASKKYLDQFDRYKTSKSLDSLIPDYYYHPNQSREPRNSGLLVIEDSTLVRIVIHVLDVNDNGPIFTSKLFTGGVTTSTSFGAVFMKVTAFDADEGANGEVTYFRSGEIQKTLAEGLDNLKTAPFLVDKHTGEISLNFYPQKGMKGYFDFMILANDTHGFHDMAHVFIYLLREDQRVRFVLRQHPAEVQDKIYKFRE